MSVSVVIPHYNSFDTLMKSVASISTQTARPTEVIIVDDCSDAGVREKLVQWSTSVKELEIRLVLLDANVGPGSARNAGLCAARGDYVAFLDSDDAWHPAKLGIQLDIMTSNPNLYATSHGMTTRLPPSVSGFPQWRLLKTRDWIRGNPFRTSAVMVKSERQALFPEGRRFAEDYHGWLHNDYIRENSAVIKADLGLRSIGTTPRRGLSSRLWEMELGELRALWTAPFLRDKPGLRTLAAALSMAKFVKRSAFQFVTSFRDLR